MSVSKLETSARRRPDAAGFTLLEVLVALIILSIGVLGVAKLTLTATRANDSAFVRTQATELAYQILDQMRANKTTALAGSYNIAFGVTPPNPNCQTAACAAPTDVANYDLYHWKQLLTILPAGDGQVVTAVNGASVTATVSVQWNDAVASATFNQSAPGAAAMTQIVLETIL